MKWMSRREGVDFVKLESFLYYIIVGTIVGARLGHCLFYEPSYFLANPIEIFKVWHGGLASHGGAVGVLFMIGLFSKRYPQFSFICILDQVSIPITFAAGLIRIGNLFNSEIIWKPTVMPWSFVFERVDQIPRHPTQIYEAVTYFLTAGILLFIYKRSSKLGSADFQRDLFKPVLAIPLVPVNQCVQPRDSYRPPLEQLGYRARGN